MRSFKVSASSILSLFLIAACSHAAAPAVSITGKVTDVSGQPIPGASVTLWQSDTLLAGAATKADGSYRLTLSTTITESLFLRASGVGYEPSETVVLPGEPTPNSNFRLSEKPVDLGTISVRPVGNFDSRAGAFTTSRIEKLSRHSLVQSNPVSAVTGPQVTRIGSTHSSKLRVNGTSPNYFINGINIGADPNHYGMFSIVPASVVDQMRFYSEGTDASFELPVAIDLRTPSRFSGRTAGEFSFSAIEANGSALYGTDRLFVLGSLRKSVLDKLVKQFDVSSDRRTLPPTNFQDVFVTSGLKLSPRYRLFADHYQVRDFLAYNTGQATHQYPGTETYQHTEENYLGGRFEAMYDKLLVKIGAATRIGLEEYHARPGKDAKPGSFMVNLVEKHSISSGNIEANLLAGNSEITFGGQLEAVSRRDVTMSQYGWNFLPPDASSDNPYAYQRELNLLYGSYSDNRSELNHAEYLSFTRRFGAVQVESGVRAQYFGGLADKKAALLREKVTLRTGDAANIAIYYGTFAESPVTKILEPYQILIRDNQSRLTPVRTKLASVTYSLGALGLGVFDKRIDNLPSVTNDLSRIKSDGTVEKGFIYVESEGSARYYGGNISIEIDSLLSGRLSLYTFYGYTRGVKTSHGVSTPTDLDTPHRFFVQAFYRTSRWLTLGGDLSVHSGQPYTQTRPVYAGAASGHYNEDYYSGLLQLENSERFPISATVSIYADVNWGRTGISLSVSNVTNRANPIVNSTDGFIYDAGILPSLGLKYRF